MDYLSYRLEEATFKENTILRRAMRKHLLKVAAALHAIEWNDSGDGADNEEELIRGCLQPTDELRQAIEDAVKARENLEKSLIAAEELLAIGDIVFRQDE